MLDLSPKTDENSLSEELLDNLTHYKTLSLPHLAALVCQSASVFPPPNTSLIIIDSLSSLIAGAFARVADNVVTPAKAMARKLSQRPSIWSSILRLIAPKQDPQKWATSRKWTVLQFLISSLQKLATLHNIAIVILGQVSTKMQGGSRAIIVPAIASLGWDTGISTRIVQIGWLGRITCPKGKLSLSTATNHEATQETEGGRDGDWG